MQVFGSISIHSVFLRRKDLTLNEKVVFSLLRYFKKVFPDDLITSKDIANELGLSITTVDNTLKKLEAKNIIEIKMVYHKKTKIALGKQITLNINW